MAENIESLKEQFKIHKRNLGDLEVEKAQFGLDLPIHLRRQIEHEQKELDRIKAKIRKINENLLHDINDNRNKIIVSLTEYNQLASKMTESENMFLSYVLLPGSQLQLTIQKRKYLEREYNRIREAIEQGTYIDSSEIESDVNQTLRQAEVAYAYKDSDQIDENLKVMSPTAALEQTETDSLIDEGKKQELTKEFRRIVIPKVHADTSEVPFEVFNTVYEAYKKRDYVLMEAFIIQYRGEISANDQGDPIEFLDLFTRYSHEYPSVLERLEKRLVKLKQDMANQEIENPEEIQIQMKRQNREIRKATFEEAEQILRIRSLLEELPQAILHKKNGN